MAIGSIMHVTNTLGTAIDKLPNRDEFDSVKKELEDANTMIMDTVAPMKKLFDDAKERENRGESIYE